MSRNYVVYTDEIMKIMDKLNCSKIIFTEDNKTYADDKEIDFYANLCEVRRKERG